MDTNKKYNRSVLAVSTLLLLAILFLFGTTVTRAASSSSTATAAFTGEDTATQGTWRGVYGLDGYAIANDSQSVPSYASFAVQNQANYTWAGNTSDPRALQSGANAGRIAATWFSASTFNFDINLTDGAAHQIAVYALDWDQYMGGRVETIQVVDANTNAVLDSRQISAFTNGLYLVWNVTGHVHITATMNAGGNSVISGVFFAPTTKPAFTPAVASFAGFDKATQGNWAGSYGVDGYALANSGQSIPSYASFFVQNQSNYTWASTTGDPRALETGTGAGRIAATWYNASTFDFDINLTDGKSHQIAVYALDWDDYMGGRAETIQVSDANTNAVLDTRAISAFTNGLYLVWNVTGHVHISATMNAGGNAVISGVFFGGSTPAVGSAQITVSPASLNFGSLNVGASGTQSFTITNSGTASGSISQIAVSGAGYSVASSNLPLSLAPGQSTPVTVTFAATSVGAAAGTVTITSSATNSPATIAMSATVTAIAPAITNQPVSKSVTVGQSATFTVANTGTAPITYQWQKNGVAIPGATSSAYTTPAAATSDNGSLFTVSLSNSAGTVTSNGATLTVTGGTLILNASSSSLAFGSVNVSASSVQTVSFTNAGTANVTISNVSISGAGFNAAGIATGTVLTPGQSAALSVTFAPAASGSVTGSITVSSNATAGAKIVSLTGAGSVPMQHSVALSWSPSASTVVGYNVYVSLVSGSGYAKLTSAPVAVVDYMDSGLQTAQTRYYVVTSVDSSNNESAYSNEVAAIVP